MIGVLILYFLIIALPIAAIILLVQGFRTHRKGFKIWGFGLLLAFVILFAFIGFVLSSMTG